MASGLYSCIKNVCIVGGQTAPIVLCDDNGAFICIVSVDTSGVTPIVTKYETDLDGNPYVPVGTVTDCAEGGADVEQRLFCDDNAGILTPYLVAYEYDEDGNIVSSTITEIDGTTPYVITGTTVVCAGEEGGIELVILCDDDTEFMRRFRFNAVGTVITTTDTELDGTTPYVVAGTVALCPTIGNLDQLALTGMNLIPNGVAPDERLTVDATVGGVQVATVYAADTTHVVWRMEGGSIRVTFDGSAPLGGVNPATANGHILRNNDSGVWRTETISAAKFIRNTGQNGVIHISQFKPVV